MIELPAQPADLLHVLSNLSLPPAVRDSLQERDQRRRCGDQDLPLAADLDQAQVVLDSDLAVQARLGCRTLGVSAANRSATTDSVSWSPFTLDPETTSVFGQLVEASQRASISSGRVDAR
jgi:hypothetical protein